MNLPIHKSTILAVLTVSGILVWIWRLSLPEAQTNKLISIVVIAVTALYALLTFEILMQNRSMAESSAKSVGISERSLRLSFEPRLRFYSLVTKDLRLAAVDACRIVPTDEYKRAL